MGGENRTRRGTAANLAPSEVSTRAEPHARVLLKRPIAPTHGQAATVLLTRKVVATSVKADQRQV